MEIQVIIRAPNQNIDDQVINCNTDWTIQELKSHLSTVYPSRPAIEDQKLIYSGHVLLDHLKLEDVLRNEDNQSSTYTLHLVCRKNNYPLRPAEDNPSSSQSTPIQSSSSASSDENSSDNSSRHRFNPSVNQIDNVQMQSQQMPVNIVPAFPSDPQLIAHMAIMQQMYAHYMAQYWQSINTSNVTRNPYFDANPPNFQSLQNNPTNNAHENFNQQPANERNNVPAIQPIDDEFGNRDWLDQVFLYFRLVILLCIIYFYTTPERFMLVIAVITIAFLYHEGWFMRQGIAEAVIGQRNRGEADPNVVNANEPLNENEVQDGHELEAAMDGDDPPHAPNTDAANNNNQIFSPLTFLATFFSSLIPEPTPPVNIN